MRKPTPAAALAFSLPLVTTAVGLAGLLGWLPGWRLLAQLKDGYIPMAPDTATLFVLVGAAALWLRLRPASAAARRALGAAGVLAAVTGGLLLLQFLLADGSDVEGLVIPNLGLFGLTKVARMSPLTALNFTFDGVALAFLAFARRAGLRSAAGVLGACAAVLSLTVLLGYAFGTPLFYGAKVIPMALTTACGFASLDLTLIGLAGPEHLPLRPFVGPKVHARLLRGFLPVCILVVFTSTVSYDVFEWVAPGANDAFVAALTVLSSAAVMAVTIVSVARIVAGDIERAEAAAAEARRALHAFLDHGPFAAFVRDARGRVLYANPLLCGDAALLAERGIGVADETDRRIIARNEPVEAVHRVPAAGGERHWHVVRFPVAQAGERGVGGLAVDLTDRMNAEREREQAQLQLLQAYKLAALGEMAGNIAHEINNPLAIVDGKAKQLCELLADDPIDVPRVRQFAQSITDTALRAVKIVNGLRTMSRNSAQDPLVPRPVRPLVDEAVALCAARFKLAQVTLTVAEIDPGLVVDCRPDEIAQVLLNLLSNAYDAVCEAGERWVRVDAAREGDAAVLRISDSGPGIAPELRARLAEPFFTTKAVGKGTGLGLSISRSIAARHGGSLTLDEAAPATTFVLRLPARAAAGRAS